MDLLGMLYPRQCYFCGRGGSWICPQCQAKIQILAPQKCPVCERGSYLGLTHPRCQSRRQLDGLLTLFPYQEPWRTMLHDYKYRFVRGLKQTWNWLIKKGLSSYPAMVKLWQQQQTAVVPIPLYTTRKLWRGFNQAVDLSQMVSQLCRLPLAERLVSRKHSTRHQAKLAAPERRRNLSAAAFSLQTRLPAKNFLLVDDVVTTGSTMRAVAILLKQAGAQKVYGFAPMG